MATLNSLLDKKNATINQLETLSGLLNFLNKAIIPGRVFTRRMYAKFAHIPTRNKKLRKYHHIRLDGEFKADCRMWKSFLECPDTSILNRPMLDFSANKKIKDLGIYSDASANFVLGFGCVMGSRWTYAIWEKDFIEKERPSIAYLELYALCIGVFTWEWELRNMRLAVYCDNRSVVDMVNSTVSKCEKCMYLLRLLTLNGLIHNRRLQARFIRTKTNVLADSLSRLDFKRFRRNGPNMEKYPDKLSRKLWPLSRLWAKNELFT